MTVIMTTEVEPSKQSGRLTFVQRTQCHYDGRSLTSGDVIRRIADYAAGYADAKTDKRTED
jgi:hypothetical protein